MFMLNENTILCLLQPNVLTTLEVLTIEVLTIEIGSFTCQKLIKHPMHQSHLVIRLDRRESAVVPMIYVRFSEKDLRSSRKVFALSISFSSSFSLRMWTLTMVPWLVLRWTDSLWVREHVWEGFEVFHHPLLIVKQRVRSFGAIDTETKWVKHRDR